MGSSFTTQPPKNTYHTLLYFSLSLLSSNTDNNTFYLQLQYVILYVILIFNRASICLCDLLWIWGAGEGLECEDIRERLQGGFPRLNLGLYVIFIHVFNRASICLCDLLWIWRAGEGLGSEDIRERLQGGFLRLYLGQPLLQQLQLLFALTHILQKRKILHVQFIIKNYKIYIHSIFQFYLMIHNIIIFQRIVPWNQISCELHNRI